MYHQFRLKAGVELQAAIAGRYILVDSTGAADGVTITPMKGGQAIRELPDRQKAFKCQVDFDTIVLRAPVDCTVGLFLSTTDVSLGFTDTAMLKVSGEVRVTNDADNPVAVDLGANAVVKIVNDPNSRVPVDMGGATVNVNATNVGINNTDAEAIPVRAQALSALVHRPARLVNTGDAQALVSDATYRKLRILNASPGAVVALGGADVTLENAAIVLAPGESWLEDDAAGAAWYATSDVDGADVRVMGVK